MLIDAEGNTAMRENNSLINQSQIVSVINKMLMHVDKRLVHHGARVAFIVSEIIRHDHLPVPLNQNKLMLLSLLHDVGAYKTEEIDEMISFDSSRVWSHSVYGYLFLKYMSPLSDESEAILYHHLRFCDYDKTDGRFLDYAALISLADRIDILSRTAKAPCDFSLIEKNSGIRFDPRYVKLFFDSQPERIMQALQDGSFQKRLTEIVDHLFFTPEDAFEYLKMMVFSVDFRSEYTVTHTINTTSISVELGKRLGLSAAELQKLYLGALLHDVGKAAISPDILEFQGRLTPERMAVMKRHVVYTGEIINGVVDEEIVKIAVRHHEKLDGSGYPEKLRESDLTLSQQIVAVADIVSALTSRRSYKEAFPKEKTLRILEEMLEAGQLCPSACREILCDYDGIMSITDDSRNPIIKMYDTLHREYFQLNGRIHALLV